MFEMRFVERVKCPVCKRMMIKHVIKEGARYHVISYYGPEGSHCSTTDCEINHGVGKCKKEVKE